MLPLWRRGDGNLCLLSAAQTGMDAAPHLHLSAQRLEAPPFRWRLRDCSQFWASRPNSRAMEHAPEVSQGLLLFTKLHSSLTFFNQPTRRHTVVVAYWGIQPTQRLVVPLLVFVFQMFLVL